MDIPKVLIVDDELVIRQAMTKALKDNGYELLFAENGKEGLAVLKEQEPSLIFLDLRMPVMDGFGFLKKAKIKPDDPYLVIAITGHGDDEEVQRCYELGVNFFLRKPLGLTEVSCLAQRCIELKRLELEVRSHRDNLKKKVEERTRELHEQLHFQQNLIDSIPVPVFFKNTQLLYIGCNRAYEKFVGFSKKKIIGKTVNEIMPKAAAEEQHRHDLELLRKGGRQIFESRIVDSAGVRKDVFFYKAVFKSKEQTVCGIIGTIIDFTERKRMEEKLTVKTSELEEANTSLRVLFRQMKQAKEDTEDNMLCNLRDLVLPYIEKMMIISPTEEGELEYKEYLKIVKVNLDKITSTFHHTLSSKYQGVSPREIQVADLIKKGKTNKNMAKLLGISMSAVQFHRDNLRKKLRLKYKKKNLKAYLLSLD